MSKEKGFLEGELCNRNGCDGIIAHHRDGSCSCHINPPCSYCTDQSQHCPNCNWSEEIVIPTKIDVSEIFYKKQDIVDDGKEYEIRRYFDDHLEAIVEKGLTKSKAHESIKKYLRLPKYYVSYLIYESKIIPATTNQKDQ